MARRGENIYHRKDGRWEGRYIVGRRLDGKPKFRSIYGKSYGEVKRALVALKSKALAAQDQPAMLVYGDGSLSDWMSYWLDVTEKPYIRETTYLLYRRSIEKHLVPWLGGYPLRELSPAHIQAMVDELRNTMASSTLHGLCRLLKSILACAVKKRLIIESPFREIRMPKFRQRPPRVLTTAEQARLERAAMEAGNLEYLLCLYTGLRLGELCALRFEDIDFEANIMTVSHSVKRIAAKGESGATTCLVVGGAKTESSVREIPLPLFLSGMLRHRMKEQNAQDSDFIFAGRDGGAAEPRTVQNRISSLPGGTAAQRNPAQCRSGLPG